jgi:hypothetical protein
MKLREKLRTLATALRAHCRALTLAAAPFFQPKPLTRTTGAMGATLDWLFGLPAGGAAFTSDSALDSAETARLRGSEI